MKLNTSVGTVHAECEADAMATPLGPLSFFVEYGLLLVILLLRLYPSGLPLDLLPPGGGARRRTGNHDRAEPCQCTLASLAAMFALVNTVPIAATAVASAIGFIC